MSISKNPPTKKTWQMRFDLSDDLRWRLREAADRRRLKVQQALVQAVDQWLDREVARTGRTAP